MSQSDGRRHESLSKPEWTVEESITEYTTGWYQGGYDLVRQPDGSTKRYYWAELATAVVVVAVQDEQVIFVEQYRPTIRETQFELQQGWLNLVSHSLRQPSGSFKRRLDSRLNPQRC